MSKKRKQKNKSKKRVTVLCIILVILLIPMAASLGIFGHFLGKINTLDPNSVVTVSPEEEDFETDEDASGQKLDPNDITWASDEDINDDGLLNILLIGQDRRPGEGRTRSDSMILVSVNIETGRVSMISFLRDLYVQIPGYSDNRINAAYAFGGMELLDATLEKNFGITVDGNIEVDFDGFTDSIDILGGVDITLTDAEAAIVGFKSGGTYHLDGEHALTYARIRYIGTDFGRTERQRTVLTALYNKFKTCDLQTALKLVNSIFPLVTTDMTKTQIISCVTKGVRILKDVKLSSYHIPSDDSFYYATIRGMSVIVPDLKECRRLLKDVYLPLY